jgi:hypothetical protein
MREWQWDFYRDGPVFDLVQVYAAYLPDQPETMRSDVIYPHPLWAAVGVTLPPSTPFTAASGILSSKGMVTSHTTCLSSKVLIRFRSAGIVPPTWSYLVNLSRFYHLFRRKVLIGNAATRQL